MNTDTLISPVDGLQLSMIWAQPATALDPCRISDKALNAAVCQMQDRGYKNVTLKVYPGMRHEIHNEVGRIEVWNDILSSTLKE